MEILNKYIFLEWVRFDRFNYKHIFFVDVHFNHYLETSAVSKKKIYISSIKLLL